MIRLPSPQAIAAVFVMASAAAHAEDVFLSLRSAVEVDSTTVRLGDVADVVSRRHANLKRLKEIRVSDVMHVDEPLSINRHDVEKILVKQGAFPAGGIAWGGASAVLVTVRRHPVDLSPGIDSAAAMLMARMAPGYDTSIRIIDAGGYVVAPPGKVTVRPDMNEMRRFGQIVEIPLSVDVNDISVAKPVIRLQVCRQPRQGARAGSDKPLLAPHDMANRTTDLPNPGATAARRGAPAPDVLFVKKDHPVHFIIETGAVRLEGEGVALSDARQGEYVKVKRASGPEEFLGRATSPQLVLVEAGK